DETRDFTEWNVFPTIAEALKDRWQYAAVDIWFPNKPSIILCESRSLRGVLGRLAKEYHAPIGSTNGQCNGHLRTEIGPTLSPGQIVLYLGDLDFSGGHIEANNRKVLEEVVGSPLAWERVAITEEQVKEFGLEPI